MTQQMQDVLTMMSKLTRPRLLIRAARIGADDYRRDRRLQRILGYGRSLRSTEALLKLMEIEVAMNQMRSDADASYSLVQHVDILIAMMGEARILRATQSHLAPVT
jgi:hypothetical protein